MIWVAGDDKGCFWFNRPWLKFTGRRMADEVGDGWGWAAGVHEHDFEGCRKVFVSHFDARKDFRMQYRLRRHDGAYRWIDDTGIPRFASDGRFLGYIGSCIDIHEQREAQAELRRRLLEIAQLNRQGEAAAVAAAIAHEIRQPLGAMVANGNAGLRWLANKTPDVEATRETLRWIVADGHRASEIVESVRTMFKKERQIGAPVVLNDVVHDVLALMDSELQNHHVVVRTALEDALPPVLADRIQLQQVLLNLIKNAIEAMTSVADGSRALLLTTELDDARELRITVADSGPGIDPKNLERVFDRFFTTKSHGMGMGLSVCRSIVEAHDGRLWAEPGAHGGSVFRISLPIGGR
jgi:PAS domain S-box-containing protein